MTPILLGRLQLRFALMLFVAAPLSVLFFATGIMPIEILFIAVLSALGVGLICDCVYQALQHLRWDGDWPTLFFVPAGAIEFLLLWLLVSKISSPMDVSFALFSVHYWSVWLASLFATFHVVHIFSPLYRYSGGKLLRKKLR